MIDPNDIVAARQALGQLLASYRQAAGLNQHQLAPHTLYGRSTVANVETGRQNVPRSFWERADDVLGAGGKLTAQYDELEALVRRQRRELAEAEAVQQQGGGRDGGTAQDGVVASPDLRWLADPVEARQSAAVMLDHELEGGLASGPADITALRVLALQWLVAPQDALDFNGTGPDRVGPGDVRRVREVCRQLKALDDSHGGGIALPMAATYMRREVQPLLYGHYDEATGRMLLTTHAELMLDMGWMAYDAGAYALAWRYMVQALRLSHIVDNRLFGGRVLAAMSHQALHLHQVPLAVDLTRAAQEGVRQLAPPKAQAMLAAMEACAQAADQRTQLCTGALLKAENALARANADEPGWLDFDEGALAGHTARALRDLGQAREAEHQARASLALCDERHSRTRAQRHTILATTQLLLGDIEAAVSTGLLVLADAWRLRSMRVQDELAPLVRAIEPIDSTAAREFVTQGREFLAARGKTREQ